MTSSPYIPSDDEATLLLDSVETETDTGRKAHMVDLLGRYSSAKKAAGLEPFQPDPVAQRDRQARVDGLYAGLDKVEAQMTPDAANGLKTALNGSIDPEESKAMAVNQAWVLAHRPDLAQHVDADWGTVRQSIAKDVLGKNAPDITDRDLYAGIGAHIQAQKARTDAANVMLGKVQDAAFDGEGDWLTAYRTAAGGLDTAEGITPAERDAYRAQAQKVFAHAAGKAKELRPLADQVLITLSRDTNARKGFEGAQGIPQADLIPTLAEMPQADRMLLYRMIAGQASKGVETDAASKGAGQKVGEKFGRQVRDIALDQIASLDQSNLAGLAGFAERLKAGEAGMIDPNTGIVVPAGNAGAADYMAKGGFSKATPEQTAAFVKDVDNRQAAYQVALELKDIAENVVDPAKFDNRIADAIANAPGQIGYTAQAMIPFVGIPLLVNSTKAMRTRELMGRGVPLQQATEMATASAILEAPIEWVQSKMLFGKIPGMGDALTKPLTTDSLKALAGRTGKLFAAEFALQNVQEAAQDATPLLMQEIAANWDPAVPKATKADWLEFADSRIDTAFTLLPITLIGTGVASFQDGAYGRAYVQNREILQAAGFNEAAADAIMAEPTFAGQQDKITALWADPAARKVGTDEQANAAAKIDVSNADSAAGNNIATATLNEDGSFTIRDENGEVIDIASTPEDAASLIGEYDDAPPPMPGDNFDVTDSELVDSGFAPSNDVGEVMSAADLARFREEERANMAADSQTGPSLLDWIKGRLTHPKAAEQAGSMFAKDLRDLWESMAEVKKVDRALKSKDATKAPRAAYSFKNYSRARAFFSMEKASKNLEDVATAAREAGFNIDGPNELLDALHNALKGYDIFPQPKEEVQASPDPNQTDMFSGGETGGDTMFNLQSQEGKDFAGIVDQQAASREAKRKQEAAQGGLFDEVQGSPMPQARIEGIVSSFKDSETGRTFETGKPVTFRYVRNNQKAPKMGARFGQDIEPAGRYLSPVGDSVKTGEGLETGTITFQSPLVIDWVGYGEDGWKARLSRAFGGRKGESLSRAIAAAGYDGIVTVSEVRGDKYASETVDLTWLKPASDVQASPLGMRMPNAASVSFSAATDQRTNAPAVIDSFAKVMESIGSAGSALNRVGRMGKHGKKAAGFFQVREQITRIKTANDVGTAAHEMAHALEDALFGKGNIWQHNQAVPQPARAELLQLGKDLYGNTAPQGGYYSEGFAEFNRLYLTDPAKAQAKAPGFMAYWEAELAKRPALAKAMATSQQLGQTWFQQGSKARAESGIVQQPTRLQQVKDAAAEQSGQFYRNFIEQAAAVEDFTKEAAEKLGKAVPADMDPMLTLTARRLTADSVVDYMANKGMLDFAGNVKGKPLVEAFQLVKGQEHDFMLYLWAKRAVALWTDPNGARNPGLDRADAEYLTALLETPQFQRASQIVYDWNNGVLDYAAQASPDFAQTVAKIRQADPGFYIPLHREFEAFDDRAKGAGGVKGKNLVAKLKGSGRRIKDPVESMLTHAKGIVLKAQQKRVLDQILALAETVPGMGHYVVEVPADQVPQSQTLMAVLEKAKKALGDLGAGLKVTGAKTLAAQGVDLNNEVLTFFAPAYLPKQNENPVLPVFRNGKVRWYEMDGELYAALSGMDTYRLPKAMDMLFGLPARTMRLGTTGLRASFSLVTNPLRDFRTLHLNSRSSANTGKLFFDWLGMMKDTALEAVTNGKRSTEWVDLAERLGVEMAQPLGQDSRPLERAARRLKRGGEWKAWDPRDQYDFVVGLLQFTETASRLTEIKNVAADMGWNPSQPLTEEIAAKLTRAGKQVTTDFTQAGSVARAINQAVPFFNAGIQGPVAHLRAIKANPTKFAIRGLMLTALALANWWRNKDEEWWKEMSLQERYGYTYVPVGDELIKIPRAFEADGLFMAGAEALADAWHQENPKQAAEWFGKWLGGFTQLDMVDGVPVPPLPVLAQMTAEQLANKNFYSGAPIVPQSQEDLAPQEQFGTYTSRASIVMGKVFGVSPRRIDHAINSIFGGVGSDLVGLLGRGNKDLIKRQTEGSDLPVIGVLFQRGGPNARNPESIEKLYDAYGERMKLQRSRFQTETFEQGQQRMMLADAVKAVAILEDVKLLTVSTEARNELEAEQIAVARDVVKAIESGIVDRGPALSAKGKANARQYERVQELGLTPKAGDTRPLRTFATSPEE